MKKIILIFAILLFSCRTEAQMVEIVPDSIASSFNTVNNGLFQVLLEGSLYSQHTRKDKADAIAYTLATNDILSDVKVVSPVSTPETSFKIYVDQSKLNVSDSALQKQIDILKIGNEIQALALEDLHLNVIPGLEKIIRDFDSLNRMKFTVLENRTNTLQSFIRDSIAFAPVEPRDTIDHSLPIINKFIYDTTGWSVDAENDRYTYLNETDFRYIVFDFNRDMIVGETYRISFQIEIEDRTTNANFDLWLYESNRDFYPEGWISPKISDTLGFPHSSSALHYFDYTVEHLDRHRLGIRAKISEFPFTISNISIKKL